MANTPDVTECAACRRQGDARLPIDPWRSLAVHFGMLLGVDDFQTVDAYHRGKMWLHSAWLHRAGVVWGLAQSLQAELGELRIAPGLAIDELGRELHLDRPACIDLGKWFTARSEKLLGSDPGVPIGVDEDGRVTLAAHVRMRFVGCLDRQVPALVEPCDGAGRTTAYSRIYETVELELVPGLPTTSPQPYPRLRMLFGLDDPSGDAEVLDARTQIAALPLLKQPEAFEQAFHRFAALDAAALGPAQLGDGTTTLLPAIDPAPFVLAELHGLSVVPIADSNPPAWEFDSLTALQWEQRPTHVATQPLSDLLAGTLAGLVASADGVDEGPRVVRGSLVIGAGDLSFKTDKPLEPDSLTATLSLSEFVPGVGWNMVALSNLALSGGTLVSADHDPIDPSASLLRLVFDGTSPKPALGQNGWPLAGADDDPPTPNHAGRDFAHIQRQGV